MPKRMTLDAEQMTPFAHRVYDYLLSFRPNKLVAELAEETGISNQTIWDWLRKGTLPRRQTVVQLAERVPDLASLDELLAAVGLPTTEAVKRERVEHMEMFRASIRETEQMLANDPRFTPEERAIIARYLESLPESFIADTDTWREWQHASPAMREAEQGTDDAAVYEPEPISSPEEAHGQPPRKRRDSGHPPRRHSQV